LLLSAEEAGYDVLITVDQGIHRQFAQPGRKLAIVVVRAPTNQIEDLQRFVGMIRRALESIAPGEMISIP